MCRGSATSLPTSSPRGLVLFSYTAYTLNIRSELQLPELLAAAPTGGECAPVTVRVATEPPDQEREDRYEAQPQHFYMNLAGLASYEVSGGQDILVKLAPRADPREVRLYLLGTCFGMLLYQRGILAFHASSVVAPSGAVLFTGPSGVGKSTLLYTLTRLGYTMLSDDVTGITLDSTGCAQALPGFPRSKLCDDSAAVLGLEPTPEARHIVNLDKTQVDLREHFSCTPARAYRIYQLHADDEPTLRIRQRVGLEALTTIVENTYRAEFLHHPSVRREHFRLATQLAGQVSVYDVFRPRTPFQPELFARALENHFRDCV